VIYIALSVCGRCRVRSPEEQVKKFWKQADFGYVAQRLDEMTVLCQPQNDVRHSPACLSVCLFICLSVWWDDCHVSAPGKMWGRRPAVAKYY